MDNHAEIEPVTHSSEPVRTQRNKPKSALIVAVAILVISIVSIALVSHRSQHKALQEDNQKIADKETVNAELAQNLKLLEQQQVFRHHQQESVASDKDANTVGTIQSTEVMTAGTVTNVVQPSNLPQDCMVAKITNEEDCKLFMVRNSAPSTIFQADMPAKPTASQANIDNQEETTANATFIGKDSNSQFGNGQMQTETVMAHSIAHPDFTVAAGELIPAVLETGINSDLPGMVRAVTSQSVYGYTSNRVLIPQGSRLIGQYSSSVVQGQRRVMVIWDRLLLPNGIAVQINSPGADALGTAGQGADSYQSHFWGRFGEATLLSILGAGTATVGVNSNDQYNSASQYRMSIAQSLQQSASESLDNTIANAPTLRIFQGAKINVFIAHDLSFYQVLQQNNEDNA